MRVLLLSVPLFSINGEEKILLKFILGGAGSGKSSRLTDIINDFARKDKRVAVIVPEQFSFDSDKKLYKKLGCQRFNKILSLSFTTTAKEIFEKYGSRSGEYADEMSKLIIMQKTLKRLSDEKQLRYFVGQASKPDFIADALKIITEFRQSGVSADDFAAKMTGADVTLYDKISDLSLIYYTYDNILNESGLKDSLTNISEAAAIAEMNGFFKNSSVFFDEFESFTGDEYQLIETIISQADEVCISLRLDNPESSRNGVFDSVKNTWRRFYQLAKKYGVPIETEVMEKPLKYKSDDLAHLNMNILRPVRNRFDASENIRIAECADLYEEADWICSEIKRLVQENGYKYRDIAVMSRQLSEYTYIFEAAFEKYDIPYSMDVKKSVMHTSIMQYISGVVGIIAQKHFSSELIFKYAKTHLCGISQERIADLENYCFEWDIDGDKWLIPFKAGIEEHPFAEQTRQEIVVPLSELRKKCLNTDCKGICRELFDFITKMDVQKRVGGIINEFKENGLIFLAKEFKRIWGIFIDILDTLARNGGEISLPEFHNLFMMMLRQISYSVPPQTLDGVRIFCAETARPDNPRIVFAAGINEGFFPPNISQSGLLNEKDRTLFEQSGISLSRKNEELIADEKLIVYKTLTHASDRLYITYPLTDSSGSNRYPSSVLKQIAGMFENDILEFAGKKSLISYSSTPKAAYINLVRYFGESSKETESIRKVLEKNAEYSARIKYLESVGRERKLSVSDSSLMRQLYTERLNISATAIDDYNTCHFKYFCKTGLKLRVRKKRIVDKIGVGNLTHRCLEEIFTSCSTKEDFDSLNHEQIRAFTEKCSREFIEDNLGGEDMQTPAVKTAIESVCAGIEDLVRHLQKELSQSQFRPAAFELDISEGNDHPILKTDDGIEIWLKGIVDRIDVFEQNGKKYLRVIDYKTGTKVFSIASLLYGINMQMLIYMFSVTGKSGKFQDFEPAGALYMPSGEAGCGRDRDDKISIEDYLASHYKMNGVLLRDRTVLNAMEKDIKGIFIPASVKKGDKGEGVLNLNKRSSSCLSYKNFEKLREYTDSVLRKMCDELYSGKIDADPYVAENKEPCSYCDYWSVCGNIPLRDYHSSAENAEDTMMEILGGEDNEQMD